MITKRHLIESSIAVLGGIGVGTALMYLLDPTMGERRRAFITGAASDAACSASEAIGSTVQRVAKGAGEVGRDIMQRASAVRSLSPLPVQSGFSAGALLLTGACCAVCGAALMYVFDPSLGRQRRQQAYRTASEGGAALREKVRDTVGGGRFAQELGQKPLTLDAPAPSYDGALPVPEV